MPTKRRFILFLIVLALMLLIKYAVGQENTAVTWSPETSCGGSMEDGLWIMVKLSTFCGMILGSLKAVIRSWAASQGRYFTGDLLLLSL